MLIVSAIVRLNGGDRKFARVPTSVSRAVLIGRNSDHVLFDVLTSFLESVKIAVLHVRVDTCVHARIWPGIVYEE